MRMCKRFLTSFDAYLAKPVYARDLYLVLDSVLHKDKRA